MILPWHRKIVDETPPAPATLLLGREGDGRDLLALALAASFAGAEKNSDLDSIVANLTAVKKSDAKKEWYVDKNTDIMAVRPDQETIPIGAVRRVIEFCAIAPIAFPRRATAILRAECMNGAAANALLKTLEEPSPDKILVLSARAASLLPPTVVSRCRVLSAPSPDESQAREWVRENGGGENIEQKLAFCGGTPLAAAETDSRKVEEAAAYFAAGKNMDIHAAAQAMSGFDGWLDCLQKWVADGCRAASGLPARYFPGGEKRQKTMCGDPLRWLDAHAALIQKRRLAAHPLSADLFVKEILNDYRRIFLD